jgi:hypothetical protein
MADDRLRLELNELFGKETVDLAIAQEILAQRYTMRNPIKVRKSLERFHRLKDLNQHKQYAQSLDKDMSRAIICSLICGTASKAVLELATRAVSDKREGRAVLGGLVLPRRA